MAELALYNVKHRNFETTMKLNEEDAERMGATKVGDVTPAEPQSVPRPSWAAEVDETGAVIEPAAEKKAPQARNKARTTK